MTDITDRQVKRTSRMWWKMGVQFEAHAHELCAFADNPFESIRYAQAAEACYWQATGEGDFTSLSELTNLSQPFNTQRLNNGA